MIKTLKNYLNPHKPVMNAIKLQPNFNYKQLKYKILNIKQKKTIDINFNSNIKPKIVLYNKKAGFI